MTIDGRSVEIVAGEAVLTAALRAGIEVPTLCHDDRVSAAGSCRLCMVEIEGRAGWVAACTTPAVPGLRVRTSGPDLDSYRRALLELVLSTQPEAPCRQCAQAVPCDLHRHAARYGARVTAERGEPKIYGSDDANPFIARGYDQCILCYRCTRVCNELEGAHAIAAAGRGFHSRIATLFDRGLMESTCTFCGQCVNACPTGALTFRSRPTLPKGATISTVRTVCPFCGTGCGLQVDVSQGRIAGVRGDGASPVSRGSLCIKGQFGWQFVRSEERLQTPLVRRDGELAPTSWDEALDEVARRLGEIRGKHGPDSIVVWSSARATNEANYLLQKLARTVLGTNNVDNCART